MFMVNISSNRLRRIKEKCFSELGFTERQHLQEWLANQPDALGEELLIIQKEFDGFDDTRERLDLLALDKDGNLVIIENKLDDSGRDVVWQALKYASYCASLTKGQIVDIYQKHIDSCESIQREVNSPISLYNASTRICEFLDVPDMDEIKLNPGNSQRVMLVAANFRKEVTSTALWLLNQGISIQCFIVTPYLLDDQVLINIDQIIPISEARELMIGINAKEAEEKNTTMVLKNRHTVRLAYWEQALEAFQKSNCNIYNNISPSKDHWLSAGSGVSGCSFNLILLHKELRVELWISRSITEENKFLFDYLMNNKETIEHNFGEALVWMRLNNKKSSRVQFSCQADSFKKGSWPQFIDWHLEKMSSLEKPLKDFLHEGAEILKQQNMKGINRHC